MFFCVFWGVGVLGFFFFLFGGIVGVMCMGRGLRHVVLSTLFSFFFLFVVAFVCSVLYVVLHTTDIFFPYKNNNKVINKHLKAKC